MSFTYLLQYMLQEIPPLEPLTSKSVFCEINFKRVVLTSFSRIFPQKYRLVSRYLLKSSKSCKITKINEIAISRSFDWVIGFQVVIPFLKSEFDALQLLSKRIGEIPPSGDFGDFWWLLWLLSLLDLVRFFSLSPFWTNHTLG